MQNVTKRVWIALYNMGGPNNQEDVEPFLRNLFTDPDLLDIPLGRFLQNFVAGKIIGKRLHEVKKRYQLMGGGSPQLRITQNVATTLAAQLASVTPQRLNPATTGNSPHYELAGVSPMMRYSEPRARSVLEKCLQENVDELWLLSQYPHCARATTGTSLRELAAEKQTDSRFAGLRIRSFASYGDEPAFIDLWTQRLKESWQSLPAGRKYLLISAHNLPLSYVAEGDPYPLQIRRTAQEVTRRLNLIEGRDWTLCWQSAVGPVKWMSPTTEGSIERLCAAGIEHFLVWPVAFVSDHIETLVEVDLEYSELAHSKGAKTFSRVKNLDSDNDFISFLKTIIHRGAEDLAAHGRSLLLRDFNEDAAGPFCSSQPAGCLCAKYYLSGLAGLQRGTCVTKIVRPEAKS
ncbi:MAG: HLIP-like ferrochelatase [Pseudomonadota bacterium]|jgi:ferrochelatase